MFKLKGNVPIKNKTVENNLKTSLSSVRAALKAVYKSNYTPPLVVYQLALNSGAPLRLQTGKIIDIDHRYRFGSLS